MRGENLCGELCETSSVSMHCSIMPVRPLKPCKCGANAGILHEFVMDGVKVTSEQIFIYCTAGCGRVVTTISDTCITLYEKNDFAVKQWNGELTEDHTLEWLRSLNAARERNGLPTIKAIVIPEKDYMNLLADSRLRVDAIKRGAIVLYGTTIYHSEVIKEGHYLNLDTLGG